MKLIIITLLLIALLSGCENDTPAANVEEDNFLIEEYGALLDRYHNLQFETDRLEKANEECTGLRDEHNALINDYHNLQTQYAILEAYFNSLRDQYNSLVEQFSSRYVDSGDIITELYKQNFNLIERQSELNEQIEAVHKGNVPILSDNLTETEYTAFHKGWGLWWETFND